MKSTDNRYLPKEHYAQAASVSQAIANNAKELADAVSGADL